MKPTASAYAPSRPAIQRAARTSLPAALLGLCDFADTRPGAHRLAADDDLTRFAVAALLATSRRYFGLPARGLGWPEPRR